MFHCHSHVFYSRLIDGVKIAPYTKIPWMLAHGIFGNVESTIEVRSSGRSCQHMFFIKTIWPGVRDINNRESFLIFNCIRTVSNN